MIRRLITLARICWLDFGIQHSCRELVRLQCLSDDLPELRQIELNNLLRLERLRNEIVGGAK